MNEMKKISYAKNPSRPAQRKSLDELAREIIKIKTGREVQLIQKKNMYVQIKIKNSCTT